jgi:hypothetical protein
VDQDLNPEIMDFSVAREPIPFTADGDRFEAPAVPAPEVLADLIRRTKGLNKLVQDGNAEMLIEALDGIFAQILDEDSAALFSERLKSRRRAFDIKRQIIPILNYLMERWGLRPSEPSKSSSTTPAETGTASTGGVPAEESTPSDSTADASST